jgi:membrane protease YdiL (CAAX protease family)
VGIGGLVLSGLATWWGWWRPALFEGRRFGPTWALISPALLVLAYLLNFSTSNFARLTLGFLLLAALGTALVGFSEELLMRGLVLVGLRGSLSEGWVWLTTSAVFGLLHGINYFYGQSLVATLVQIAFAALLGTVLYATRMLTGTLLVPMALHALNDFSAFLTTGTGGSGTVFAVVVEGVAEIIALIALRRIIAAKMAERRDGSGK